MSQKRSNEFRRNSLLEDALYEMSALLGPGEAIAEEPLSEPEQPVLFVIGAPRSGTTLSMQTLASSGVFGYPSNLLSRFYAAPYIGTLVQKIATDPDYDFKNEMSGGLLLQKEFVSEIGKTIGALQPSEFWYFWRRFIPNDQPRHISPEEESKIDITGFRKGVAALEKGLSKPIVMKGLILQYNLPLLLRIFPKALFLFVRREPVSNIKSLLIAREKHTGDRNVWFSVMPPGWEALPGQTPKRQVAGQILLTNHHIEQALKILPPLNQFTYEYEDLCTDPAAWLNQVAEKIQQFGTGLLGEISAPPPFRITNSVDNDFNGKHHIQESITWVYSKFLCP